MRETAVANQVNSRYRIGLITRRVFPSLRDRLDFLAAENMTPHEQLPTALIMHFTQQILDGQVWTFTRFIQ